MLHRAARNAYSWWWASHVRTKQSKWLEQNLQDMEEKVEYILEVLEQEGESFSQRAEMYYRRRPEIVNFVEDSFHGYIALAARYDHLSRDLQSANRTIAAVYPEQVQLAMDDEDEENFPPTSTSSSDRIKPSKNSPAAPKLNIPKLPKIPRKNSKAPARLMSSKGLIKMNVPTTTAARPSGMRKAEALKEIDELQKNILGLQIEKEFVKGLHERGLEKYWEIEGEITEMQGKVNSLQDELGIDTVVEDDEARTLMTATALKLCQETLTRLQEKQQQSDEETRKEHQRIKEAHEKLEILKEKFGSQTNKTELPESPEFVSISMKADLDQEVDTVEQETHELELLKTKVKEQLKMNCTASLTMSTLVEKIDDLVDKVITLETAESSQNALVTRLRSETNKLQGHLQNLEEEKEVLIEGSDDKSNRIRELEIEFLRIQNLNHSVRDKKRDLQIHFTEASYSVDHLSEKLHTVKLDEEVDHIPLFEDSGAIPGVALGKDFLALEDLMSPDDNSKILKGIKPEGEEKIDVLKQSDSENVRMGEEANKDKIADHSTSIRTEDENFAQFNTSSPADNLLVPVEVREVPNADPGGRFKENAGNVALGYNSVTLKNARMEGEVRKDNVPDRSCSARAEENFFQPELSSCFGDLLVEVQATSVDNLAEGLDEHEDIIAPGDEKMITEDVRMSERDNTGGYPDHLDDLKAEKENSFQLNPRDLLEDLVNGQVRGVLGTNSGSKEHEDMPPANDPVIPTDVKTEKEEKKHDNQEPGASAKAEDNIAQSRQSNQFDDLPRKSQVRPAQDVVPERTVKEHKGVIRLANGSMISRDMIMGQKEHCKSLNRNAVRGDNDQSNPSNQLNSLLQKIQVEAVPVANPGKGFKEHENVLGSGNNSLISTGAKDDISDRSTPMKANKEKSYIQPNSSDLNQKDQEPKKQNRELGNEDEEDQPNWRQLFLKGLGDREKILLQNYILILKNYKAAKIKSAAQIKELKHANALKDTKIQSLYKKLNLLQIWLDEALVTTSADFTHSQQGGSQPSTAREAASTSLNSDKKQVSDQLPGEQKVEPLERKEESTVQQEQAINFPRKGRKKRAVSSVDDECRAISKIERRLRVDIDGLLEENIELWLRFSTSLHQIRKFRSSVQDLLGELTKIRESKKQGGSTKSQPLDSDVRPIYKHLREIQTELALWLEHNALLEDDSKNRLSALESILEEILRLSNGGGGLKEEEEEEEEEESFLSDFQAGIFRGEVMNMKQENNKVAEKLMAGLQQVKELQIEITTALVNLEEELGISVPRNRRTASSRSRSPMRTFLLRLRNRGHHSSNGRFELNKSNISTQTDFH